MCWLGDVDYISIVSDRAYLPTLGLRLGPE